MERRYSRAERRALPVVRGVDDAVAIVKALVCEQHTQGQLVVAIDAAMRLAGAAFRCTCERCDEQPLDDVEQLIDLADELDGVELVLATFVEPDRLAPTAADVARFEGWRVECREQGVSFVDHLLFSGHRWRSIREVSPW